MKLIKKFENYKSREEMCDHLCNVCGCNMNELEEKSDSELQEMCDMMSNSMSNSMSQKYENHSMREEMCDYLCNVCGRNMNELEEKSDRELQEMCDMMKSHNMMKSNMTSESKKSKTIKEHQGHEHYMFFANLENMHRMCKEMLEMDKDKIDHILSDGHGWAVDHVSTSKDDVEEVYNFLNTHRAEHVSDDNKHSLLTNIQSFEGFKK